MVETYKIYDIGALPVYTVARLVLGLRPSSRTMMALSGQKYNTIEILLASCLDSLKWLVWSRTEDGYKNQNRPDPIAPQMVEGFKVKETIGFATSEEFEEARKKIFGGE